MQDLGGVSSGLGFCWLLGRSDVFQGGGSSRGVCGTGNHPLAMTTLSGLESVS